MTAVVVLLLFVVAGLCVGWLSYRLRFKPLIDSLREHLEREATR